jgi:serine/threonine-protein kinase HipA
MSDPIEIFYDWSPDAEPRRFGTLTVRGRGNEIFDFTFHGEALDDSQLRTQSLDPELGMFAGLNFPEPVVLSSKSSTTRCRIAGESR